MIDFDILEKKLNIELSLHQKELLRTMEVQEYVAISRETNKFSPILGIYILYRLMEPFSKNRIVVTGPSLLSIRPIAIFVEENLYQLDIKADIKISSDIFNIKVQENEVLFLNMVSGERIRGRRANILIINDSSNIDQDEKDMVFAGYTAIAINPIEAVRRKAYNLPVFNQFKIIEAF